MRFPFSLTCSMSAYIAKKRLQGSRHFPLVLMLEPLHACNLRCNGCGRIREYADTVNMRLTPEECVASVKECGAPIVSVCGGEPLIYPELYELLERLLALGKHIYLCTNGQLMSEKAESLFRIPGAKRRLYWNVHLDSSESAHDAIVGKTGAFQKALEGIRTAKEIGFYVYTNSTLFSNTTVDELEQLAETLKQYKIDGMMIAPGFGYESVDSDDFFLRKSQSHALFQEIRARLGKYRLSATPTYMSFLCGERSLSCAAWANPTRNVKGWKGPCYLITDAHYGTYSELISETNWSRLGHGADPRCENCLMHCGFEPAAVFETKSLPDLLKTAVWSLQ